jgi:Tol biopolymer transport system component
VAYAAGGPGPETGDVWAGEVWLNDVWITDVVSGTTQRVTADGKDNNELRWSPDGTAVAYSSAITPGDKAIFVQTLDGAGPRPLTRGPGLQWPSDWTPDGRAVLFTETRAGGSADIWIQPLDGAARPYPRHQRRSTNRACRPTAGGSRTPRTRPDRPSTLRFAHTP